ncbi:MAG: tryptophan synthase subunit alpha [Sphingomonadaceae bacterium]|nr:tryptophan synthase subunit alpha [Sphingomonadaceae bacterium]MDW8415791.1 tryptophan synthase subunit alpha [Thermaurantiacus sp.]
MKRDRLAERLAALGSRPGLVAFACGGDPSPELGPRILAAMVKGGADLIEVGVPFSDPMADGPSIQAGNRRALSAGTTLRGVLDLVARFRRDDDATPVVLMGYANPVLAFGIDRFAVAAARSGVDGVILVDVPPEESAPFLGPVRRAGLHWIRLATPTTDDRRLPHILSDASGFLYHVAVAGVTGVKSAPEAQVAAAVAQLKAATVLPVAVGFGVRTPAHARTVARHADLVVVGSAVVDVIGNAHARGANDIPGEVERFVASLAEAVRTARPEVVA